MTFRTHILTTVLLISMGTLSAQTVKDLQREQAQIQKELATTKQMLSETKKSETTTVNRLNLLNRDIQNRKKLIRSIGQEINALDEDMTNLTNRRGELQEQLERYRDDYATLVRKTHYADLQSSPLLFLLSSKSFQQLMRRMRYMREFASYREQQVRQIRSTQDEIDIQNQLLADRKAERGEALKAEQREKDNLSRDERKQQAMLKDLKKKESQLIAQQRKQQKKVDELNKKIEDLIRKQVQSKTTLTKEQQLIAGGFQANQGKLPWPVEKGFISGFFGTHKHPVYEHVTINNKGIYIQTVENSDARAVYQGEVTSCIVLGNTYAVIVQHGNYRSVYSNLSKVYVKQGDKVDTKQAVGRIYSDPDQDNKTELYFQIYQDRNLLNPSLWLAQ
ncbi:MAG: peptidoglycan DD-metalloendopeptidase family protein [Bacteroidales bacterium]|nr:peptidoglycan DD-metalloendopeptidase family protein [Candidatus Colicola coprequi]